MKTFGICIVIIGIFSGITQLQTDALKYSRATSRLTLELLVVADYSEFNQWYQWTSTNKTVAERTKDAVNDVKKYVSALVHSSNNVFRSLEPRNISIAIKLVDVLVMTTVSDSPWTETVKVAPGTSYIVDPAGTLPLLITKSTDLQRTIPHDHAMFLTKYTLTNEGETVSGYAYIGAVCKPKSVSIVEDKAFHTANTIAHELGHSLGCQHDGTLNPCPSSDGYAMLASFIQANKKKWTFSSCSVNYIQNYLGDLKTNHNNCLEQINSTNPNSVVETLTHQWYGQVYDLDEQCRIHYGPQSHFCRDQYNGNYTGVCLKMFCHDPVKNACFYLDGGDGTPCGTGKWCISNECVSTDVDYIQIVDENCAAGDTPGEWFNNLTCHEIGLHHKNECALTEVKTECCFTCSHLQTLTAPTDVDGQCVVKHGPGSYMCRAAPAYYLQYYPDIVCWDFRCSDPTGANSSCLSTEADNYTSCGTHRWCQNKFCVYGADAPTVPEVRDDCPWGDQKGVVKYGLTCDQIKHAENKWRCYENFIAKVCCAACYSVRKTVQRCQYGDKMPNCEIVKCSTYDADTKAKCCATCAHPGHAPDLIG